MISLPCVCAFACVCNSWNYKGDYETWSRELKKRQNGKKEWDIYDKKAECGLSGRGKENIEGKEESNSGGKQIRDSVLKCHNNIHCYNAKLILKDSIWKKSTKEINVLQPLCYWKNKKNANMVVN